MFIDEFINQFNKIYPDVDRFDVATDEMVAAYEKSSDITYLFPLLNF